MEKKGLTDREVARVSKRLERGGFMTGRELTESTDEQYRKMLKAQKKRIKKRFRGIWWLSKRRRPFCGDYRKREGLANHHILPQLGKVQKGCRNC